MTGKIAKYMLVTALLVIMAVTSGCALARGASAVWHYHENRNKHSALSNKIEEENCARWWMTANLSDEAARLLQMDLYI
ncbi:hypothetical protein [Selenomonas ruminantium]|jgi:hypothetical protein|uniref:Lipoprotein n=1 Tax=Selenomonas ruminantium TaxID=971 RepID=A0A1K1LX75_SELRU|nr:hypothetical protein [Selenomonas ruminantium]SFA72175.1 hypothetical protein SAMN05216587_101339 [Selenomonas ruminantium]SFW15440.1 hypothetical protein SAMN02910323_0415 [Selenomonas ruminantium]